ncbi:MAG: radical SAM family heme chaperone HemW [Bacteroidales bacterium]
MSGIYIHIPFCKKRCHYCDFFSSTHEEVKMSYTEALCKEATLRREWLTEAPETLYVGGGTPSQLTSSEIRRLFGHLQETFGLEGLREVTFEANPDDITPELLQTLTEVGVNRLSMGIQSFNDELLKKLNRRHTAAQAVAAVELAKSHGLTNISIDLMYGLPGQDLADWNRTLDRALALDVPHISSYHLTYEEGTILYDWLQKGWIRETDEELSLEFFETLIERLTEQGYEQYEISNFAKEGCYSQHNSSYWKGIPYLGLGASAHSYNLKTRSWNPSSLEEYFEMTEGNPELAETEYLDEATRYNDYIITGLRTKWGVRESMIREHFAGKIYDHFVREIGVQMAAGNVKQGVGLGYSESSCEDDYTLTRKGIFISDAIFEDLLWVD